MKTPRIVETESAFVATLFEQGGTADGYVMKRGKRFVDVFLHGRNFRINRFGVWCMRSEELWQHAVLELGKMGYGMVAMADAASSLSVSREWVGGELQFNFK